RGTRRGRDTAAHGEGRRALARARRARRGAGRRLGMADRRRRSRGGRARHRGAHTSDAGVLDLGSGLAGRMTALRAAEAGEVLVVTKRRLDDASTNWAQGGIAAVFDARDSATLHERDTLKCGAGLCDPAVVREVVREAPARVLELASLGVGFTRSGHDF